MSLNQPKKLKRKIKVLFVTASTTGGGAERMLFNIIRSLDSDHEVRLFITSDARVPQIYREDIEAYNADKVHAVSAFPKLIKYIREYRPDHVFTTSSNIGYLIILAKKLLPAKYKTYIRCAVPPSEIYQTDLKTRLLNRVISMTYNSADLVIAQTDFSREDLIKSYNLSPDRVRTIRNIVDTEFVNNMAEDGNAAEFDPDNYNIVAAGALYSVKGFDLLIDAIAPLIQKTNRHLYILGEERYESGYRAMLHEKIKKANAEANIHLAGHKSNPYPYFKAADLFVMSSRKEGYPNVVLEALTLDTPVVATDCVDWNNVIEPGVNGIVVRKNDVESLREGLIQAFDTNFESRNSNLQNFDYNQLFQ